MLIGEWIAVAAADERRRKRARRIIHCRHLAQVELIGRAGAHVCPNHGGHSPTEKSDRTDLGGLDKFWKIVETAVKNDATEVPRWYRRFDLHFYRVVARLRDGHGDLAGDLGSGRTTGDKDPLS